MRIIPAIDLQAGRCVRLFKGDFAQVTEYSDDPLELAGRFASMQVDEIHVVDLDGARTGSQQNQAVVAAIAAQAGISVQVGGGIRDGETLRRWLAGGVARCVIGSLAVSDGDTVAGWIDDLGAERIVLALDVNIVDGLPLVATHGWARKSTVSLWDCVDRYGAAAIRHVLCTDIGRDGAMLGPNLDLYSEFLRRYPDIQLQASGGVRHIADIEALRDAGVPAAITGRALLDGRISDTEVRSFRQSA